MKHLIFRHSILTSFFILIALLFQSAAMDTARAQVGGPVKIRAGSQSTMNSATLQAREVAATLDTGQFYIGDGTGKVRLTGSRVYTGTSAPSSLLGVAGDFYIDTSGRALYLNVSGTWSSLLTIPSGGSGTVTSVALTVPSGLSVSGSPLTGAGTIAISTSLSGIIKGTGSGFAAATAGTDYAAASHSHAASDITSGTIATARLGSGTASSSTFLRGDSTWATVSGSSAPVPVYTVPLLQGESSPTTGARKYEFYLPLAPDGSTLYYAPYEFRLRLATAASSGNTTVAVELSQGTGAFSSVQTLFTKTVSASNRENTSLLLVGQSITPKSGDKIRINVSAVGTGADGLTAEAMFTISTTDPL